MDFAFGHFFNKKIKAAFVFFTSSWYKKLYSLLKYYFSQNFFLKESSNVPCSYSYVEQNDFLWAQADNFYGYH